MGNFDQLIEQKLQQARERGDFDRLSGSGSPLAHESENPFEDPTMRLAYGALRRGGYSLPWIEEQRDLDTALAQARADLARAWQRYQFGLARQQPAAPLDADWQGALENFRGAVGGLNRRLLSYNLRVPLSRFQLPPFEAEALIAQVMEAELELPAPPTPQRSRDARWLRYGLPMTAALLSAAALLLLGPPAILIVALLLVIGLAPLHNGRRAAR